MNQLKPSSCHQETAQPGHVLTTGRSNVSSRPGRRLRLGVPMALGLLGLTILAWPRLSTNTSPPPTGPVAAPSPPLPASADPPLQRSSDRKMDSRLDQGSHHLDSRAATTGPLPSEKPATPAPAIESLRQEEIRVASQLLKDFPGSVEGMILMGNVCARCGQTSAAVTWWQRCLEQSPRRPDAYAGMAMLALQKGQYAESAALWKKALEIHPRMTGAHNGLARALLSLGKTQEAIAALHEDLRISPEAALSHFLLAQAYLQRGEYAMAKPHYEAVIQLQPDHWNAYYGLATIAARQGETTQATEYRRKFQELKAAELKMLIDRANATNDLSAARQNAAQTYSDAGLVCQAQGSLWRAEQHWQKAAELDPNSASCRRGLLMLYLAGNQPAEALRVCEQLATIQPADASLRITIGDLRDRLGDTEGAEAAYLSACHLAPAVSAGYCALARIHLRDQRLSEAKMLAEKAVGLAPTAFNYRVLSEVHERSGDRLAALEAIRRALELEPDNPDLQRLCNLLQARL